MSPSASKGLMGSPGSEGGGQTSARGRWSVIKARASSRAGIERPVAAETEARVTGASDSLEFFQSGGPRSR